MILNPYSLYIYGCNYNKWHISLSDVFERPNRESIDFIETFNSLGSKTIPNLQTKGLVMSSLKYL